MSPVVGPRLQPTLAERSRPGRGGGKIPHPPADALDRIPASARRATPPGLPELAEPEVVRHYVNLSQLNYAVDTGFYPLGSCTMKYNPRINEDMARLSVFARLHPLAPAALAQGALGLMYDLAGMLAEIAGMDAVSLQPAAGAQGELAGVLMIRAYHEARAEKRTKVLIPDSAHGTNPASTALAGYEVIEVKSDAEGRVELGDLGFDVCHFNLHKTFTTPHGGGGPGAGPVGVKAHLEPFLPAPVIVKDGDGYALDWKRQQSIGKLQAFWGNVGMHVRAYAYIRTMGADGLRAVSENAVLNANYVMKRLESHYDVAAPGPCMHECVVSARRQKKLGVSAMDVAKRLLDLGFYAPSTYFPLIVEEALMIEPTETESKETLDAFCEAMIRIAKEAETDPHGIHQAPVTTPVRRLDQTKAAREPNLRWRPTG